jgi:predicted acetyltransferase
LLSVFHGPSPAEFHAQLDEPGYEPSDRLLVKEGEQLAAHVRLARQTIQLGSMTVPACRFMDLATGPEYRSRGLATALLAAAERAAAERGALVALTRTRVPALFARLGWTVCGRHLFSTAAPRAVLAELSNSPDESDDASRAMPFFVAPLQTLTVRPLRRIELPAVVRLYEQNLAGRFGWPIRSEAYWEWLLARGACDRLYIAATEPDSGDLPTLLNSIVGYAFVRQFRVAELVTAPNRQDVARHLLARVCADVVEQDGWQVRFDGPADHFLHELLHAAAGEFTDSREIGGEVFMAKLLDPLAVLRRHASDLAARAKAAQLRRPFELGLELRSGSRGEDGVVERYRLKFGRRSTQITTGGPARHCIAVRYGDLAALVLGDMSAQEMAAAKRLKASSRKALLMAGAVFPGGAWWHPPLDDLLA